MCNLYTQLIPIGKHNISKHTYESRKILQQFIVIFIDSLALYIFWWSCKDSQAKQAHRRLGPAKNSSRNWRWEWSRQRGRPADRTVAATSTWDWWRACRGPWISCRRRRIAAPSPAVESSSTRMRAKSLGGGRIIISSRVIQFGKLKYTTSTKRRLNASIVIIFFTFGFLR